MKSTVVSFMSGIVFAVGLGVGGMTQPAKVIGFLDFTGNWDPSLALVMLGAIGVHALSIECFAIVHPPFTHWRCLYRTIQKSTLA